MKMRRSSFRKIFIKLKSADRSSAVYIEDPRLSRSEIGGSFNRAHSAQAAQGFLSSPTECSGLARMQENKGAHDDNDDQRAERSKCCSRTFP